MTLLLTLHVLVTIAMIAIILWQKSDGSASLVGAGSSSSMFTARGVANFLTHTTAILASIFLFLCIFITWYSNHQLKKASSLLVDPKSKVEKSQAAPTASKPLASKNEPLIEQKSQEKIPVQDDKSLKKTG